MSVLPCENPSCRSYGQPHPNCRCHGGLAEGGDVAFCSTDRKHDDSCEYFADGGDTAQGSDTLPEGFQIEDQAPAPVAAAPEQEEGLPPGFEIDPAEGDLPPGFQLDQPPAPAPEEHGLSLPTSPGDSLNRVMHSGLLQEVEPEPAPGTRVTDEQFIQAGKDAEREAALASMFTGSGAVGLTMKGLQSVEKIANMGKIGKTLLSGMIGNGLVQGEDEASKWMLGQGDPQDPAGAAMAHIGAAGLFGLATGALGGIGSAAASSAAESKLGSNIAGWLAGFGSAGKATKGLAGEEVAHGAADILPTQFTQDLSQLGGEIPKHVSESFNAGKKAYSKLVDNATKAIMGTGGAAIGYLEEGLGGAIKGANLGILGSHLTNMVSKRVGSATAEKIAPAALYLLNKGTDHGFLQALDHAANFSKGAALINRGTKFIGGAGDTAISAYASDKARDRAREKLDQKIQEGGPSQDLQQEIYNQSANPTPQPLATGGEVATNPVKPSPIHSGLATHYPDHDMVMNIAKGRIYNYLSGLRPKTHSPKLAFDGDPDTTAQKKIYNRALDIANKPLAILDEIKNGTVEAEHVKHFNAMYPELRGLLQKKMTSEIVKAQLDGKRPSSGVRQGLSMFMGTALSGELQPSSIQAAQAVFAQKKDQQDQASQQKPKTSSSSAKLTKSDQSYLTDDQARSRRQQKT